MGVLCPEGQASDEPVALETAVVATGARPGDVGAKRELFSEETQTVLVFEKGAVIRLSAAVADGQLLFLTNKKTGKEVVTQVVRKRSFRPTSCYVDLEFTDASPGFWGIEFPKSAPAQPSQVASDSSDDEAGESVKHAAPPDQQEVERLKKEVSELQNRLKSFTGSPTNTVSSTNGPDAGPADAPSAESAIREHEEKALEQLFAQEAQQEQLHGPKRLVAYPKKEASSVAKAASKVAMAGAIAAVAVAAAIMAYRFGLFDSFTARSTAAKPASNQLSGRANSVAVPVPKPTSAASLPANHVVAPSRPTPEPTGEPAESLVSKTGAETSATSGAGDSTLKRGESMAASTAAHTVPKEPKRRGVAVASGRIPASPSSPGSISAGGSAPAVIENSNVTTPEDYVAPKLVYSVKPISPPDALRNYVTGNVNVDAIVDATGHVKSVTVISGPQKLRNQAIAEMKQYVYEPARKNGKPVGAHVQTSLKYWYEP